MEKRGSVDGNAKKLKCNLTSEQKKTHTIDENEQNINVAAIDVIRTITEMMGGGGMLRGFARTKTKCSPQAKVANLKINMQVWCIFVATCCCCFSFAPA